MINVEVNNIEFNAIEECEVKVSVRKAKDFENPISSPGSLEETLLCIFSDKERFPSKVEEKEWLKHNLHAITMQMVNGIIEVAEEDDLIELEKYVNELVEENMQ